MEKDGILYHYCSIETFLALISKKELWLSSLTQSNDHQEGLWYNKELMKIAEQDGLRVEELALLDATISFYERLTDVGGMCFSEESDLLSQWRGYADDGRGFSLGFRYSSFLELVEKYNGLEIFEGAGGLALGKVEYGSFPKDNIYHTAIQDLKRVAATDAPSISEVFGIPTNKIFPNNVDRYKLFSESAFWLLLKRNFLFKNPAFHEEEEWRLMTGFGRSTRARDPSMLFRSTNDRIVTYRKIGISELGPSAISKVVLGPKNASNIADIQSFLSTNGFGDVKVERSLASYR